MTHFMFFQISGNRVFPAHRFMLSIRSLVFNEMFSKADTIEARTGRVVIEDLQPETVESLIEFVYTDQVQLNHSTTSCCNLVVLL